MNCWDEVCFTSQCLKAAQNLCLSGFGHLAQFRSHSTVNGQRFLPGTARRILLADFLVG
jgi:hypothetical protein